MIRGGDFYAIWIEERGLWSTDEQDALQLIDRELDRYAEENRQRFNSDIKVLHMWDAESGMIDSWHTERLAIFPHPQKAGNHSDPPGSFPAYLNGMDGWVCRCPHGWTSSPRSPGKNPPGGTGEGGPSEDSPYSWY